MSGMHEYAVTESIMEIIQAEADKAGGTKVTSITIVIGELSTFVDDSIDFYFKALSQGTIAEGATLSFEKIEAKAICCDCGKEFQPTSIYYSCPECHSPVFDVKQGQELYVDNLEIN